MSKEPKNEVKTKKVKARIIDENNDLVFGLIEVPESDPRPEFDPKTMSLHDKNNKVQPGKGPQ